MACISSLSTEYSSKKSSLTVNSLDLPHIVNLYREEAVARIHVLPIPPHRLPWLPRTIKEGKDVFINNMTIILNYYAAACKILQVTGHMTEAGELKSRRLHLKTIFDGLNVTMISMLRIWESQFDGVDENGDAFDFCTFGFSALEAEMSKHLKEGDQLADQRSDTVSIGSQNTATETSSAEAPVAGSIVESGPATVSKPDDMLAEAFKVSLAPEATEQQFQANNEAVVEQYIQDGTHAIVTQFAKCSNAPNEPANSSPAATSDPMESTVGSLVNSTLGEPNESDNAKDNALETNQTGLKRAFDDLNNDSQDENYVPSEKSAEESERYPEQQSEYELSEDEETIIITEADEDEGDEALPETSTHDEQISQQCHEAVLSGDGVTLNEHEQHPNQRGELKQLIQEMSENMFITEEADDDEALSRDLDSATSPIQGPNSDDSNEAGFASSYLSHLGQDLLEFLEDVKIAEGFLTNTSDEEDHGSCTVHAGRANVPTEGGYDTDDDSVPGLESELDEGPTSAETTLLEDGDGDRMGDILFYKDQAVAEEKKKNASVKIVKSNNRDELDNMPESFAMKPIAQSKGPKWSIRAILGTVAAVGISMSLIYPTFSAFVLFGIIRFARNRR